MKVRNNGSPEARVTSGFKPHDAGAGNRTQILWKSNVLLTAEPPLQSLSLNYELDHFR